MAGNLRCFLELVSFKLVLNCTLVHPGSNLAYVIRWKLHFGSSPISADTSASHKQSPIDAVHRSQQKMAQVFSNIFGGAKPSPPPVSSGDSGKLPCGHLNRGRTNQTPPRFRGFCRSSRSISNSLLNHSRRAKFYWSWTTSYWFTRCTVHQMVQCPRTLFLERLQARGSYSYIGCDHCDHPFNWHKPKPQEG